MARVQTISQTGVGTTAWQATNRNVSAFHLGVNCSVSGSATFNVEVTNTDILSGATANALPVVSGQTTSQIVGITTPCSFWRINVTSGTGTVLAEGLQSGLID